MKTQTSEFAVVLQGLVETKDNATLETARLYRKMYPHAKIILSTWDYTDVSIIKKFENENFDVVLSKDIDCCGTGNVNYQITTSLAGIKKAKELGCKYTLKNRADLRLYRENGLQYLKSLLQVFPVLEGNPLKLKGRIITQAGNWGQMFIPNWLQDFWYFGYTEDLLNLFSIPLSNKHIHSNAQYLKNLGHTVTGEDLFREVMPELYITSSFLNKNNKSTCKVKDFWQDLRDFYIIVDQEAVLSHWMKYNLRERNTYYVEYDGQHNYKDAYKHISHEDWLNIYTGEYKYEDWMENEKNQYKVFE